MKEGLLKVALLLFPCLSACHLPKGGSMFQDSAEPLLTPAETNAIRTVSVNLPPLTPLSVHLAITQSEAGSTPQKALALSPFSEKDELLLGHYVLSGLKRILGDRMLLIESPQDPKIDLLVQWSFITDPPDGRIKYSLEKKELKKKQFLYAETSYFLRMGLSLIGLENRKRQTEFHYYPLLEKTGEGAILWEPVAHTERKEVTRKMARLFRREFLGRLEEGVEVLLLELEKLFDKRS